MLVFHCSSNFKLSSSTSYSSSTIRRIEVSLALAEMLKSNTDPKWSPSNSLILFHWLFLIIVHPFRKPSVFHLYLHWITNSFPLHSHSTCVNLWTVGVRGQVYIPVLSIPHCQNLPQSAWFNNRQTRSLVIHYYTLPQPELPGL